MGHRKPGGGGHGRRQPERAPMSIGRLRGLSFGESMRQIDQKRQRRKAGETGERGEAGIAEGPESALAKADGERRQKAADGAAEQDEERAARAAEMRDRRRMAI